MNNQKFRFKTLDNLKNTEASKYKTFYANNQTNTSNFYKNEDLSTLSKDISLNNNTLLPNNRLKTENYSSNLLIPYYCSEKWCTLMKNKVRSLAYQNNNTNKYNQYNQYIPYQLSYKNKYNTKNNFYSPYLKNKMKYFGEINNNNSNSNYTNNTNLNMNINSSNTNKFENTPNNTMYKTDQHPKYALTEEADKATNVKFSDNNINNNINDLEAPEKAFLNKIYEVQKCQMTKMFPKFRNKSPNNKLTLPSLGGMTNYGFNICNTKKNKLNKDNKRNTLNYFYLTSQYPEENKKSRTIYDLQNEIGVQAINGERNTIDKNLLKQRYITYINKKSKKDYIKYYYNFGEI